MSERLSLRDYLALDYPFHAEADPEGGYTVVFPDLPGCLTVAETLAEISAMALDAKQLWIETEYERGHEIPLPSYPAEYSGKFNVRLPKSLHRRLAEAAAREDVSLNQLVVALLAEGLGSRTALAAARETLGSAGEARATDIEETRSAAEHPTVHPPRRSAAA
jgi:predicted RNase H-like HicB family nuclease